MKVKHVFAIAVMTIGMVSCGEAQTKKTEKKSTTQSQSVISKVVSQDEFKKLMKKENVQLVDVRTSDEYNSGHIGNAKNIDFYNENFKTNIAKLDKNKPVLVYCAAGGRSGKAREMMKSMGFKEVYDLEGGYGQWKP